MNRRVFIKKTAGAAIASVAAPGLMAGYRYSEKENRSILNRVISKEIPVRWEDSMLSGNGSTGIMVNGIPLEECIIINHEKFWTVGNDYRPDTPDMAQAWGQAKKIAQEGRYLDADMYIVRKARERYKEMYGQKFSGNRPAYDRAHPGFHFVISTESNGRKLIRDTD